MGLEGTFSSASDSNRKCCFKGQLAFHLIKHWYFSCQSRKLSFLPGCIIRRAKLKTCWHCCPFPFFTYALKCSPVNFPLPQTWASWAFWEGSLDWVLFRSRNKTSPGHRLEFRLNFCHSSNFPWSQTVVLAARSVTKHFSFIVTRCELSSLCSEKGG